MANGIQFLTDTLPGQPFLRQAVSFEQSLLRVIQNHFLHYFKLAQSFLALFQISPAVFDKVLC